MEADIAKMRASSTGSPAEIKKNIESAAGDLDIPQPVSAVLNVRRRYFFKLRHPLLARTLLLFPLLYEAKKNPFTVAQLTQLL